MNFSTVKKILAAGAIAALSTALLVGCGGGDSAGGEKKFLNIGTGGTAG